MSKVQGHLAKALHTGCHLGGCLPCACFLAECGQALRESASAQLAALFSCSTAQPFLSLIELLPAGMKFLLCLLQMSLFHEQLEKMDWLVSVTETAFVTIT